jgi:ABC transporter substrate binding protein
MKRREFLALGTIAAVGWPRAARAQQPAMPVIGFLSARSPAEAASVLGISSGARRGGLFRRQERHHRISLGRRELRTIASNGAFRGTWCSGAARALGLDVIMLSASTEGEIDTAFAKLIQQKAGGLIVGTDPFLLGARDKLARLAAQHAIPTMYFLREFVEAGGLMSYGPDIRRGYRQAGVYAGYILKGANPAELPVLLPTNFLLSVNLRTTRALGLTLPATLLALADEVIE